MPLWLRKRTSSKDLYKAKIIILFRKSENKCTSAGFANWTAQTMRVDGLQAVRSDAKALMFSFIWGSSCNLQVLGVSSLDLSLASTLYASSVVQIRYLEALTRCKKMIFL